MFHFFTLKLVLGIIPVRTNLTNAVKKFLNQIVQLLINFFTQFLFFFGVCFVLCEVGQPNNKLPKFIRCCCWLVSVYDLSDRSVNRLSLVLPTDFEDQLWIIPQIYFSLYFVRDASLLIHNSTLF